ncbi:MAG: TOBE domain-containing protein [Comamonadaceae bacterium]|nr:TOBE domain-containing protein [Comamonadaceae bacterium]
MTTGFPQMALHGSVWMTMDGASFGGAGRVALLALVAECGSITQAAKAMKMSYKAAWDAIDAMNTMAGEPLVERLVGGKGGGGTRLTPRGQKLVRNFRHIEQAHRRFIEQLNRQAVDGLLDDFSLLQRMSMQTSARNQFFGTVQKVTPGAANDMVSLQVPGLPAPIVAAVTCGSTRHLGLAPGMQAFALVKASSVIVATAVPAAARFSARNQLHGVVSRVQPGAVNAEVTLALADGATITATVTRASSEALALTPGTPALAMFKASSVIVGLPF